MKLPKKLKRLAIDMAGYTMLLLSLALGWLPGPGGIPLFLGGLALLSINNDWAKRLRSYLVKRSDSYLNAFFPNRKLYMWLWDFAVILAVSVGVFAIFGLSGFVRTGVSAVFLAGALIAFAKNRQRFERIVKKLKK